MHQYQRLPMSEVSKLAEMVRVTPGNREAMGDIEQSTLPRNLPTRKLPSHEEIKRLQWRKLRSLLEAILPANPFYHRKLTGLTLGPAATLEDYRRLIPFTTRHELVRDRLANPPYGTNLTYPADAYVRCHQTSGTTTMPIRWLDTAESWSHIVDNWVRILGAAGVTRRTASSSPSPSGRSWASGRRSRPCSGWAASVFPAAPCPAWRGCRPSWTTASPWSVAPPPTRNTWAKSPKRRKLDLTRSRVRLLIVAGEGGGSIPATRARIERLWPGAAVFDHHGMTEVGPVTYQCPAQPGVLHVLESAYLPEVVNPANRASRLAPGETGELVLTTLDRLGSPLLRYRTGDLVKPRALSICACGRHELALEGGILGRSDDMVVVRGVNVYPSLVEEIVRAYSEVAEYRVQLDCRSAMTELSLEVEPVVDSSGRASLPRRLEQSFQAALNLRVPVVLVPAGSLPRFEMKAQRWMRVTE